MADHDYKGIPTLELSPRPGSARAGEEGKRIRFLSMNGGAGIVLESEVIVVTLGSLLELADWILAHRAALAWDQGMADGVGGASVVKSEPL